MLHTCGHASEITMKILIQLNFSDHIACVGIVTVAQKGKLESSQVCSSHFHTKTLGKGMNPFSFSPSYGLNSRANWALLI